MNNPVEVISSRKTWPALVLASFFACVVLNVSGREEGVVEIHGSTVFPAVVLDQQNFRITYTGYNLLWGISQHGAEFDFDEHLSYTVELEENVILLDYTGPGICVTPGFPTPLDYRPHALTFRFPGLPAGDYTVQVNMELSCGDGHASYQHPLTIYEPTEHERIVYLETPVAGQTTSGVGLIRGWACYADLRAGKIGEISYQVDDGPTIRMAYGDSRTDTEGRCGLHNSATGFAAAEFWGKYGEGVHELKLMVDGEEVERRSFRIAAPEEGFIKGLVADYFLSDFPSTGRTSHIEWSEADQNFISTEYE